MKLKNILPLFPTLIFLVGCSIANAQEKMDGSVESGISITPNEISLTEVVPAVDASQANPEPSPLEGSLPKNQTLELKSEEITRPAGWSEKTHGQDAEPNYEIVFPQDKVNRLDISIDPDEWSTMMEDMTSLYGEFGAQPIGRTPSQREWGLPQNNSQVNPDDETPKTVIPSDGEGYPLGDDFHGGINPPTSRQFPPVGEIPDGGFPQGERRPPKDEIGPGGRMEGDENNPVWVPAKVEFNGDTWEYVGIRFKGNSSLFSSWRSGNLKLPLKLDFDQFEDVFPEIDDQRFYGFKQLSLASNFHDDSLLREKVAADIFRDAGLPAAQTSFYQVFLDYGEGPVYFGLYTMVEVVDDTLIQTQFTDDSGNVYKPSGRGANFAVGSFNEAAFDKETNQDEADWGDVISMFNALHSETRLSDPQTWRQGLEAVFDVNGFLKWLAVNTVIQNWDSYGIIAHNYYLYNNPATGKLTWIPWDNNEALQIRAQRGTLSLSLEEVGEDWPLIRYLMDDDQYYATYNAYIQEVIENTFYPEKMIPLYQELHDLIQPYVIGSSAEIDGYTNLTSEIAFNNALNSLIKHTNNRYQAAKAYLASIK